MAELNLELLIKMKKFGILLFVLFPLMVAARKPTMLESVNLRQIHPEGWLQTMLLNQRNGLTGYLDTIAYPFDAHGQGWGAEEPYVGGGRDAEGKQSVYWVPYEQSAYYFDGVIRCGYLLHDNFLIDKATRAIYATIAHASMDGVLEARLSLGENRRWPHAVFFRAWMAQYEQTGDERILQAMERHFLNDTVTLRGRDLCNIESMWWLYTKTGNKDLYKKIMSLRGSNGLGAFMEEELGDFASPQKQEVHGVTYNEFLKIPIIYYLLTGDQSELERARNGFAKLDKYHMLPDGVSSCEEGTSGKGAQNVHELCDVVDYIWSCSYMLRATGETQWADRMERATFNAGLGSITKDFAYHQYFSCPNQVFCGDYSCHVTAYSLGRMAYRQMHRPPCCTGNVNRMLPILVGHQWLKGDNHALYKAIYGPGSVEHQVDGQRIVLREESVYPYSDTMKIEVVSGNAYFPLWLRIPGWCQAPRVLVNGEICSGVEAGRFFKVERQFNPGDIITVIAPKQPEFINWNDYDAMVVNYGPLLFALPVKANVIRQPWILKGLNKPFWGYTMTPNSDWNYVLGVDGHDNSLIQVVTRPITEDVALNPWIAQPQPIELRVPMYQDPTWKPFYQKVVNVSGDEVYAPVTSPLPARGAMIYVLRTQTPRIVSLVPYGSTELRMSMFPFWKEREISPEVLAAEE